MGKALPFCLVLIAVFAIGTISVCFFLEVRRQDLNSVVFGIVTLVTIAMFVMLNMWAQEADYPPEDSMYRTTDQAQMIALLEDNILLLGAIGISFGMTIYAASANGVIN